MAEAPWKRRAPRGRSKQKMTPAEVERARQRAEDHGRPYPNLVDNLWVIRQRGADPR
jgi:hypothetical protein